MTVAARVSRSSRFAADEKVVPRLIPLMLVVSAARGSVVVIPHSEQDLDIELVAATRKQAGL
jgi:hypothetical protein